MKINNGFKKKKGQNCKKNQFWKFKVCLRLWSKPLRKKQQLKHWSALVCLPNDKGPISHLYEFIW